jgi:SSS family solute:Na+ symporter
MAVDSFTLIILTIIYLAIVIFLGYLGYRRTKKHEDYLVAGRKIHPAILALSYGATFISTSAIVGFGGVAAQLGMGLIWLTVLNIGIGILLAFVIFGKKTREIGHRLKAVTFPDLLGKCYGSEFMRTATGFIIIVGMPIYTAAILIGGARFIETTLNIPYNSALLGFAAIVAIYVVLGGLIAVMYTDALQGTIMFIGMSLLILLTYSQLGGIVEAHTSLTNLFTLVPEGLRAAGHTGWASMPQFGSPIWLTLITTIVLGVGIGVLAQPQLAVRFMTVKDSRSLHRAVLIGGPFILMMTGVAFTVGALTNVYFMENTGMLAVEAAGGNIDSVIPAYINASMPDAFVIVFMLALLAAAMSTLSSLFHTMGTSLGHDLWNFRNSGNPSLRATQTGCVLMIGVSVALAYIMPISIIARATAMFMGLCASAFLPAYALALYSNKPSKFAAKGSLIVGALTWFLWTAFVHVKESQPLGISHLLFGKDAILSMPWQVVDPLIIALPLSLLTLGALFIYEQKKNVA